jgi:hypothetical protein
MVDRTMLDRSMLDRSMFERSRFAADAFACIGTRVGTRRNFPLEERMAPEVRSSTWLQRSYISMSINNEILAKLPVWQGF